jgi:hypothetical protein
MKNKFIILASSIISAILIYISLFVYTYFNYQNEFKYTFENLENFKFHEKYSKKLHHIRDEYVLGELFKKPKTQDLLFSTINSSEDKKITVLFQGDSWMEQLTFLGDRNFVALKLIQQYGNKNKVHFINSGIGSYSPSLMNVQLTVLEEDFKVKPDILITYIDQTDIGDELCRYKNNKVYKNDALIEVKPETHFMHKNLFNYAKTYELTKISLSGHSKVIKIFQLINFKFEYGFKKAGIRFYIKYLSSNKEKITKCYWENIEKYLTNPKNSDVQYFKNSIKEYIKNVENKKNIKKLIFVTFPHKKHFESHLNQTTKYKLNISDIVDDVIKDNNSISHINFSKILLNNENFNYKPIWLKDNVHLNSDAHGNIFTLKILQELTKHLY